MTKRSQWIVALIIFAGLSWAVCSDVLISELAGGLPDSLREILRGANNLILFGLTAFLLYRQIRRRQRQLEISEKQYRDLFDGNPNPMWVFSRDTLAFLAANEAAIEKYGYSRDEFLAMTIRDIRPATDIASLEAAIKEEEAISISRNSGVWRHLSKAGELFYVSIISHDLTFDGRPGRLVTAIDITRAIENEKKLVVAYEKEKELNQQLANNLEIIRKSNEQNQLMAQVIDKISNLVLIIKENGMITWVNKAFIDFTGYTFTEAVGKRPGEILFGPETEQQVIQRLLQAVGEKHPFTGELINYKKNGDPYWTQLNISPIYDEDGTFKFFVSVENIITERKKKEEELLQQHATLQQIAWSNSHELRKPLCSLLGLINVLKIAGEQETERRQCIALLEESAQQLDKLITETNQKIDQIGIAKIEDNRPGN